MMDDWDFKLRWTDILLIALILGAYIFAGSIVVHWFMFDFGVMP